MSEVKKYREYILSRNNTTDQCDIDYSLGKGNQPIEVAKAGVIDLDKYDAEIDDMFRHNCPLIFTEEEVNND
ncbi:MAG: hypothetical protein GY799_02035 [Desulfobulbaceae bacterium]|nr:hypothetical protein [Desulfobulbaceae bacterium]